MDDTDLLHEGLDINQHASDECTTPSELPKTLECLPMEEDPSQDALQGPSQDALQGPSQDALEGPSQDALQGPSQDALEGPSQDALQGPSQDALQVLSQDALEGPSQDALQDPSQDALQGPSQDALQDAIRQSRKLNDNEKYELLISEQKGLADADLNTIWFSVAEGRKRKRIQFQRRWLQDYKWL